MEQVGHCGQAVLLLRSHRWKNNMPKNDALFTFSEETVENIIAEVCIPHYDSIDVNIDITVPVYVTVSDQTATDAVKACTILWVRTLYK